MPREVLIAVECLRVLGNDAAPCPLRREVVSGRSFLQRTPPRSIAVVGIEQPVGVIRPQDNLFVKGQLETHRRRTESVLVAQGEEFRASIVYPEDASVEAAVYGIKFDVRTRRGHFQDLRIQPKDVVPLGDRPLVSLDLK